MKYYTMEHRGGLYEALETRKEITYKEFINLLSSYILYCYDERINCHRYILRDIQKGHKKGLTTWLLKEYDEEEYIIN